jgi:hypothetical protein
MIWPMAARFVVTFAAGFAWGRFSTATVVCLVVAAVALANREFVVSRGAS